MRSACAKRRRKRAFENRPEQQKVETKVIENKSVIVVEQANPQVIYVPSYDPYAVYGPPIYPYPPIYYPPAGYYAAEWRSHLESASHGAAWVVVGAGDADGRQQQHININNNNNFIRNSNINAATATTSVTGSQLEA